MPPVPCSLILFVAIFSILSSIVLISFINIASLFIFGFFVYNPSTSDNKIKQSAPEICATLEANLSLSPYLISDVAILSFSLTIGTKPKLNRFSNVLLALIALLLFSVSSRVNNICERLIFFGLKNSLNKFINSICPIDATA